MADLREISMKNYIYRDAVKWDLVQKPIRILKDINEAEQSECENLPLSDGPAAGMRTVNLLNIQKSEFVYALSTCP